MEPDFVGTSRCRTTPTLATEDLSLLSLGGVSIARIEADSFVFDRRAGIVQRFQIVGVGSRSGKLKPI